MTKSSQIFTVLLYHSAYTLPCHLYFMLCSLPYETKLELYQLFKIGNHKLQFFLLASEIRKKNCWINKKSCFQLRFQFHMKCCDDSYRIQNHDSLGVSIDTALEKTLKQSTHRPPAGRRWIPGRRPGRARRCPWCEYQLIKNYRRINKWTNLLNKQEILTWWAPRGRCCGTGRGRGARAAAGPEWWSAGSPRGSSSPRCGLNEQGRCRYSAY